MFTYARLYDGMMKCKVSAAISKNNETKHLLVFTKLI